MNSALAPRLRAVPAAVWLVVLMATGTAIYQYPTYHPAPPLVPYVLGCGLLILGFALGARWAFVVCVITAWIFPFETLIGIKAPRHGATLTALHFLALALLWHARAYYWKSPRHADAPQAH